TIDGIFRRRQPIDLRLQVAGNQVPVHLEGQLRISVPQDASDRIEVDASSEQQRGGGVPRVVQAEAARNRLRPEEHSAAWTVAPLAIGVFLLMRRSLAFAPAAQVQVAV